MRMPFANGETCFLLSWKHTALNGIALVVDKHTSIAAVGTNSLCGFILTPITGIANVTQLNLSALPEGEQAVRRDDVKLILAHAARGRLAVQPW